MSKDYTVSEMKEFLRSRNLSTTGSKAELVVRLEQFDANIWNVIAAENTRAAERTACTEETRAREASDRLRPSEQHEDPDVDICDQRQRSDDLVQRELELLRRGRMLMQRELEIFRSTQVVSTSPASPGSGISSNGHVITSPTLSIQAIGGLVCEFDGRDNSFWKWEQQINLLRANYQMDDNTARVLISSKLKGRAAEWFHSKSQHLILPIDGLLKEMKTMFDHRPSKLALRKQFENRIWTAGEPFVDYFHDKVILGNRVPIAADELVDYVIDGITDSHLRNQVRIMRIRTPADLLESFENISLETGKSSDRENKGRREAKESGSHQKETAASTRPWGKTVKCFNCSETGHISSKCLKPKRQRGSCFDCGSTAHLRSSCPRRAADQPGGSGKTKELSAVNSANMVQPTTLPAPYMVQLRYGLSDSNGHQYDTTYKLSYYQSGCQLPAISYAPVRKYFKSGIPMEDHTTHKLSYWPHEVTPREVPPWSKQKYVPSCEPVESCTTYKLSYWPHSSEKRPPIILPDTENVLNAGCCTDNNTTYRLSYFGSIGDKRNPIRRPGNIPFSSCPLSYDTIHKMSFPGNWCVKQEMPIIPCDKQILGRGPIQDITTQKYDYTWKTTPLESDLRYQDNLTSGDAPLDCCTTYRLSYLENDNKGILSSKNYAPIRSYYPSDIPMKSETVMQLSYQPVDAPAPVKKPWSEPPPYHRPVLPIDDNTTYNTSFIPPGILIP